MVFRRWGAVLVVGAAVLTPVAAHADTGYVPGQFIAKQYTEALGRVSDQAGWRGDVGYFESDGCNATTLANVGRSIYTSSEFTGLGYDNDAKVLALYRGSLNREPDKAGFDNWTGLLKGGMVWATVVDKFFGSDEFNALVPKICTGVKDGSGSSYQFGTYPALTVPTGGTGFTGSGEELQKKLDATAKGGTVYLAQKAVVRLDSRLTIPPGVTLATIDSPDPRHYALMGRLVRDSSFNDRLVVLGNGSHLTNVWVDGARNTPENSDPSRDNVVLYGGTGTAVTDSKISNSAGPQAVYALGAFDGYGCADAKISGNVITAYSSDHVKTNTWSDGVAVGCEHATVTGNQVVDASDVPIVLYQSSPVQGTAVAQQSQVKGNTVLNAGNSAYGGLGIDPLFGDTPRAVGFEGASVTQNTMWTSPNTHYVIALADGTRSWFGPKSNTGTGGAFSGNTTGSESARVVTGIGVTGMLKTTVTGNTMNWSHITGVSRCPHVDIAASISAGTASGTFSPTPVDVAFDSCV
ncbi:DUF4214 domain-containing protein [Actinoallomurus sp. CA-150999]|uniref:DUF4214 domain-containing protein n=1 Tax=Actinoallomurus sp. CA-150999 TaxID=3239887 RepID=UPI003D8AA32B